MNSPYFMHRIPGSDSVLIISGPQTKIQRWCQSMKKNIEMVQVHEKKYKDGATPRTMI